MPILYFLTVATKTTSPCSRVVYVTVTCQQQSWFFPRAWQCQSCFLLQPMILERHCKVLLYNLVHLSLYLTTTEFIVVFLRVFHAFCCIPLLHFSRVCCTYVAVSQNVKDEDEQTLQMCVSTKKKKVKFLHKDERKEEMKAKFIVNG